MADKIADTFTQYVYGGKDLTTSTLITILAGARQALATRLSRWAFPDVSETESIYAYMCFKHTLPYSLGDILCPGNLKIKN